MRLTTGRRSLTVLIALGTLALIGALMGTQATPAGGASKCPQDYFCVWADTDFQGEMVKLSKVGFSRKIHKQLDNQASSAKNRRSGAGTLYEDKDGGGGSLCLAPGNKYPDLAGPVFDNVASSSRLKGGHQGCTMRAARPGRAATKSDKGCPEKTLCVWEDKGFQGQRVKLDEPGEVSNKLYDKMNDRASSLKNNWKHLAILHADVNGEGDSACFPADGKVRNLAGPIYDFDERASSSKLLHNDPVCVI